MNTLQATTLALAMAGALLAPGALMAADAGEVDHSTHHPAAEPAQPPATAQAKAATPDLQTMRKRMAEMRATPDADQRMQLMEAQMKDMEALLQNPARDCPRSESQGGMGMKGSHGDHGGHGGMDMKGGHGKMGMMGKGMSSQDDMLEKRMEMMEKRMDLMQMLLQKTLGTP